MGLDIVGPGAGLPSSDDWHAVMRLVDSAPPELNRTPAEAYALARTLRDDPYTETWIARNGDNVVGFAALHLGKKQSEKHTASLRVLVFDGFRGQGVGTHLVEAALKWADENNITRITAMPYVKRWMSADGSGARYDQQSGRTMSLFRRYGFNTEGVMRNAVKVDGELSDMALMARVK